MSPAAGAHLIINADGGSRGNPGPAGAGAVLYDQDGQEVAALSKYLGKATNNVAEYEALILGLAKASELGAGQVSIKMDSELVVRQIQGRYKVKAPGLKPLYAKAKRLLQDFDKMTILHIPRAENSRADELANLAMDRQ